jgi:DNA topoisomerase-3
VGDHYGLIPTEQAVEPARLDADELKVYRLIAERFLDLFRPAYVATVTVYTLALGQQTLTVKTTSVQEPGFKPVAKSAAPKLAIGATVSGQLSIQKQQTTPPARLNEATLLGKMDHYGLGTPATRADIIDKLLNAGSMVKRGRELAMTAKGQSLLHLVNPDLVSPELTAQWEAQLKAIEKGQTTRPSFMTDVKAETKRLVLEIKQSTSTYQDPNLTQKKCPECGHRLREKPTKVGVKLQCSNPECHYSRFRDPKVTNHRCPQCHKKMVVLSGTKGDYFKCQNCGTTEQMAAAKGGKKGRVNKRETQRLLKQYSKASEPEESPLAAALKAAMAKK